MGRADSILINERTPSALNNRQKKQLSELIHSWDHILQQEGSNTTQIEIVPANTIKDMEDSFAITNWDDLDSGRPTGKTKRMRVAILTTQDGNLDLEHMQDTFIHELAHIKQFQDYARSYKKGQKPYPSNHHGTEWQKWYDLLGRKYRIQKSKYIDQDGEEGGSELPPTSKWYREPKFKKKDRRD